jgi:predicted DCC family thiol-disulfide oxidoreductase YuxK
MITVFYDASCGLCRREILYYQKIAPKETFIWIDISENATPFTALGFSQWEGMKALHVKDASGTIYIGVDAFITMWKNLGLWRIAAVIVSLPLFYPLTVFLYSRFATWRFKKRGYDKFN